jgi:hypothetical protein
MKQSFKQRWSALAAATVIGVGLAIAVSYWPQHYESPFAKGQSLLGKAAESFTDSQTDLQFKPPPGWSMQGRTWATPEQLLTPRMIVKYKRLIPNVPVAWLRVYVHQTSNEQTPASYLQQRKLPEKNWKVINEVERDVHVGKEPAARITYAGPLDPDGRGSKEYAAEYYVLRRGKYLFEISGMYPATDETARDQCRASIQSVSFSSR